MVKRDKKKKMNTKQKSAYSGRSINGRECILIEEAIDYLRSLGHLVSNKAFMLMIVLLVIITLGSVSAQTTTYLNSSGISKDIGGGYCSALDSAKVYNQTWLNFNQVNYSIQLPNSSLITQPDNIDNFTIVSIVKVLGYNGGIIFSQGNSTNSTVLFEFAATIDNGLGMNIRSTNNTLVSPNEGAGASNKTNGIRSMYSVSKSLNNFTFNLNGENTNRSIKNLPQNSFGFNNVTIGRRSGGTLYFNGSIYGIYLFNYSLTSAEIKDIYQNESIKSNYTINKKAMNAGWTGVYQVNSTLMYYSGGGKTYRSNDQGESATQIATITSDSGSYFWANRELTSFFMSNDNTGNILASFGNDTNWTNISVFSCQNTTGAGFGTFWHMDEDSLGNLYLGEYGGGNTSLENCSYVHKSTDGGRTWSIIYNGTALGYFGRHIHITAVNPYNDYIYISQGDWGIPSNSSRFLVSKDYGNTWTTLMSGTNTAQFTSILFLDENCKLLGTDNANYNSIIKTCDDVNFNYMYNITNQYQAYIWEMSKDPITGYIISTTRATAGTGQEYVALYISPDNGLKWFSTERYPTNYSQQGFFGLTNFNELGNAFYKQTNITNKNMVYRFNFSEPKNLNPVSWYKLDENSGTTAYDSSRNGNNGTISGATWQNDGVLVSLRDGVDYDFNSPMFRLLNPQYDFSNITLTSSFLGNWLVNQTYKDWYPTSECINESQDWQMILYQYDYNNCGNYTPEYFYINGTLACTGVYTGMFTMDLESRTTMVILGFLFIFVIFFLYFRRFIFAGGLLVIIGFLLLFNGFSTIVSLVIILGGILAFFLK